MKGNLIYLGLFVGLTLLGLDQRIALSAIYVFAILYMFVLNKYYVFKDRRRATPRQVGRHLALYGVIWVINIVFFQILAVRLRTNGYIVQLLFAAIMAIVVFFWSKYFVFSHRGQITSGNNSAKASKVT